MKRLDVSAGLSREKTVSVGILLFWLLLLWASFDGFYFYDDVYYLRKAVELLRGGWQLRHVMDHRLGLYAPVSLFVAWGGVNEWTTVAYPVLCVLLVLILFWRFYDWGWVATLFLITDYYVFHFAAKLYPDTVLMLWVVAVCMALDKRHCGRVAGLWAALALFAAFLTKETIIWMMPALLLLFIQDMRRKQYLAFWQMLGFAGGLLLVLYFACYAWAFGHPLYRFWHIQAEHSPNYGAFSYYDKPWIYTLRRITYQPLLMFVGADMWVGFSGAMVALIASWRSGRRLSVWGVVFLSMLGMFWFFTTSFRYYNPITLHARMVLPLVPLAAAVIGRNFFSLNKKALAVWGCLLWAASVWCFYEGNVPLAGVYFLKGSILWGGVPGGGIPRRLLLPGLIVLGLIHPMYAAYKAQTQGTYRDEKYLIQKYFSKGKQEDCLVSDNRLATGGDFYFAFRKDAPALYDLMLVDNTTLQACRSVWLLKNKSSWNEFRLLGRDYEAVFNSGAWEPVECRGNVCLYRKRR